MPRLLSCCTWSFISEMSGVMTMQSPSRISAGTWKQMLFPPPVGISANVSRPPRMLSMTSL